MFPALKNWHGDYDHMGEAINLVNNFKVDNVIFNCDEFNDIEKELNNAFKTLIELSDQEIQEVKNIIDEIIEYIIQDEEIINHLFRQNYY